MKYIATGIHSYVCVSVGVTRSGARRKVPSLSFTESAVLGREENKAFSS